MRKCIVFGSGSAYLKLATTFNVACISVIGIVDNDKSKWGEKIQDLEIQDPECIWNYEFSYILICSSFYNEISEQLKNMGVLAEKIINYYEIISVNLIGRNYLANSFLKYSRGYQNGIEIGAGHAPVKFNDKKIKVKYVDYMQHTEKESFYKNKKPVQVDIIDEGEKLEKIKNGSQDFIIACHMLEHCRNPIGTIRNFLIKIRSGGIIFLAIPDKRYTVDKERELTKIDHLLLDDKDPNWERDLQHLEKKENENNENNEIIKNKMAEHIIDLHYHVWNADTFGSFLHQTKEYLGNSFEIEQCGILDNGRMSNEILVILKKIGG